MEEEKKVDKTTDLALLLFNVECLPFGVEIMFVLIPLGLLELGNYKGKRNERKRKVKQLRNGCLSLKG